MITTPQADLSTARQEARLATRRRVYRAAAIAVLGPTAATFIYYAVIDPPEYECKTEFTIQGRLKPAPDILAGLGLPATSGQQNDQHMLADYLISSPTVALLRSNYGFTKAYSHFSLDPTAYLDPDASLEWALKFWSHKIKVDYDNSSDATTVTVKAYRPEDAYRLTRGVLQASTNLVDFLNAKVQQGSLAQAIAQVASTKRDLDAVKERLAHLQGSVNALTYTAPSQEAQATVAQIDSQLAQLNVNLGTVQATYRPDAPQAMAVKQQIAALVAARKIQVAKALTPPGAAATQHDVMLQAALLDWQFASKAYLSAEDTYLAALPESQNKNFVVPFVPPVVPQQSNYWKRFLNVIAVFLGSTVLFGVGALSYSVIKDHIQ